MFKGVGNVTFNMYSNGLRRYYKNILERRKIMKIYNVGYTDVQGVYHNIRLKVKQTKDVKEWAETSGFTVIVKKNITKYAVAQLIEKISDKSELDYMERKDLIEILSILIK